MTTMNLFFKMDVRSLVLKMSKKPEKIMSKILV